MNRVHDFCRARARFSIRLGRIAAAVAACILVIGVAAGLSAAGEPERGPGGFRYFVGVVGNPSVPDISWSELRAKGIHFLLTLAAQDARMVQHDDAQFALVAKRIEGLLEKDVENQGSRPEVVAKLAEFRRDPRAWIAANLAPRSYESKASPDWSKWVPRQD